VIKSKVFATAIHSTPITFGSYLSLENHCSLAFRRHTLKAIVAGDTESASKQPNSNYQEVPFYRKQSFFWLMWVVFSPVAIGVLITGDVYYCKKGEVKAFGMANRIVAGIIGIVWLVAIASSAFK
jgi:hypothetical protein